MAHYDRLSSVGLSEAAHLHMTLFRVWNGQHAAILRIQRAKAIWIVACIQAVNQRQISKVVDISLDS